MGLTVEIEPPARMSDAPPSGGDNRPLSWVGNHDKAPASARFGLLGGRHEARQGRRAANQIR